MTELDELIQEHRAHIEALRATVRQMREASKKTPVILPFVRKYLLLSMAEGLIEAHQAAKFDDNGLTLDLIEDALRHVGERLATEHGDDRSFVRKKFGPM